MNANSNFQVLKCFLNLKNGNSNGAVDLQHNNISQHLRLKFIKLGVTQFGTKGRLKQKVNKLNRWDIKNETVLEVYLATKSKSK